MILDHEFNPLAYAELEEAVDYLESENRGTGLQLALTVEDAIFQVRRFPESGPVVVGDIRAKVVARYKYTIYYSARPGHIRILAVASHYRQPFYRLGRH